MIVVAIIGILAAIAVPSFQKYIQKSRMAEAPQALRDITQHEIIYYDTEVINAVDFSIRLSSYLVSGNRTPLLADIDNSRKEALWTSTSPFNEIDFSGPEFVFGSYGVTGSGSTPERSIDITALFDLADDDCSASPAYNVRTADDGCSLFISRIETDGMNHHITPIIQDLKD
ncbi:MAG: hypothetical protein KDD46_00950 [Bdellovibrionales bacterium]|nr:hypothetical protein [Bdellovibrionales bacterium]